ncbi:hypothetical protein BDQ17DRAFT_1233860 [Cyathus striatus]|nr:hypothetical protein BDQ17DRAFT_1233860 [Cyathus striatus]
MDSIWGEDLDYSESREAEWTKISSEFTNSGYREGITAGKEGALQEGFDSGFAEIGAPLGRDIGILRGIASALFALLSATPGKEDMLNEARDISSQLSRIRFSDIVPRDLEAEEHARQHLESDEYGLDVNEGIADKRDMEGLEDMLAKLSAGATMSTSDKSRPKMDDVRLLKERLGALTQRIGIDVNWS